MADNVAFDPALARTYRSREAPKRARVVEAAAGERTTIRAPWGEDEHFIGPWVEVLDEQGQRSYGVSYKEFFEMHERIPGTEDGWRKTASVDAYRYQGTPGTVTTIMRDGFVETVNTVRPGDWLVRHTHGEITVVLDEVFRERYDVEHPLTPA